MNMSKKKKIKPFNCIVHIFFIVWVVICLIPFILVVSVSLSTASDIATYGYTLIPKKIDFTAYRQLFQSPKLLLDAYKVTVFITVTGTLLYLALNSSAGYVLARIGRTKWGVFTTYFLYIPTLFGGGLTASYIIRTRYFHLADNLLGLILPGVSAFSIFMFRTFIKQQPVSLIEAAKMDGASEYLVYFKIALPLAKPALGTFGFTTAMSLWNSWYQSMIYIRTPEKITLQHMLQRMMMHLQSIMEQLEMGINVEGISFKDLPTDSLRMAMLTLSAGPALIFFPYFQKYFSKGMVIGSVKG